MHKFLILLALSHQLASAAYQLPSKPTSIQVKQAGVKDVLEVLLNDSGFLFEFEETISNKTKVSINSQNKEWDDVFQAVLAQSKLTYNFDSTGRIMILEK
jgi:hypothetical protein